MASKRPRQKPNYEYAQQVETNSWTQVSRSLIEKSVRSWESTHAVIHIQPQWWSGKMLNHRWPTTTVFYVKCQVSMLPKSQKINVIWEDSDRSCQWIGWQNVSFRGHSEDRTALTKLSSTNRGNFLEMLHLLSAHDASLKGKLETNGARWTSWLILFVTRTLTSKVSKILLVINYVKCCFM